MWAKADRSSIDQSLGQAIVELERKIRSEVTEELTNRDAIGRPINPKPWDEVADSINGPNGHKPTLRRRSVGDPNH